MISSRSNGMIRFVRKLHQKKYRRSEGLFIMEGLRCTSELLMAQYPVHTILYSLQAGDQVLDLARQLGKRAKNQAEVSLEIMDHASPRPEQPGNIGCGSHSPEKTFKKPAGGRLLPGSGGGVRPGQPGHGNPLRGGIWLWRDIPGGTLR